MSAHVNIDNLAALARDRKTEAAWRSLWSAVFAQPAWFGISSAQRADALLVVPIREQHTIIAFTDEHKARAFINRGGAKGAGAVVRLALPGALTYLSQVSMQGVSQILFNPGAGVDGFGYGLAGFARLASSFGIVDPNAPALPPPIPSRAPPPRARVSAAASNPDKDNHLALFSHLLNLPEWHVLGRTETGGSALVPAITPYNGAPVILAFTSNPLAQSYIVARDLPAKSAAANASVGVISMPVASALAAVESQVGLRGIVLNDASHGIFIPTQNLRRMHDHFFPPPSSAPAAADAPAPDSPTTPPGNL